jgi:hypothetical protein
MRMLTAVNRATGAEQEETIARAMAFPMDAIVARYMDEEGLPSGVAREHERELKRYLVLCALDPAGAYGMNGPVDELWHTFITFTRDYARFCDEVGGRFIHHVPTAPDAKAEPASAASYRRTLDAYAETFGEEAPPEVWPRFGSTDHPGSSCLHHAPSGPGSACGTAAPAGSACGSSSPAGSSCTNGT